MPTFNTSIKVMAIDIPIEVDYKIINEGCGPTYSPMYGADGGEAPEIEILSIEKKSNGEDITEWCGKTSILDDIWFMMVLAPDHGWQDKIRTAMFGLRHLSPTKLPYKLTIQSFSCSYLEQIELRIIESEDFAEACRDRGEYD